MNGRKTGVRIVSLLLALCLTVGVLPADVLAVQTTVSGDFSGEGEVHYLMFATDRHANTTIIGSLLTQMEGTAGDGAIEYVGLGGDMVGEGSGDNPEYDIKDVLDEVTAVASNLDNTTVDLVYASGHDQGYTDPSTTGIMNIKSGLLYEGDEYYVYGVIEDDIKSADNAQTASAAFVTWATGADVDQSKVIIVLSHFPLHAMRGDNVGAGYWHTALNAVAIGTGVSADVEIIRDIVFFHGHNHSQESTTYLQGPNTTLSVESLSSATGISLAGEEAVVVYDYEMETYATSNGTDAQIYYTYATAGYLNAQSKATLFSVSDDSFNLTVYNTSGATADTLTVDRISDESATPVTLEVTGESEYTRGEAFVTPTVAVKYSDGSSKTVTGYTVEGAVDTDTEGTYTLTYSYTEDGYAATAVFTVNVVSGIVTVTYEDALTVITATSDCLTEITVTDVYDEENPITVFGSGYYVAYDIALEGYTAGNSVTYTVLVENGVDLSGIELYYVNADGSVEPLTYTTSTETEDGYEYITLTFTTDKVGTFAYGTPEVSDEIPENATLSGLIVTGPTQKVYFLETSLVNGNVYLNIAGLKVIAQYTLDGENYYKTLEWNQFDESFDGYALETEDLTTYGEKTVTVSYGNQIHQFKVWVCTQGETDSNTTVSVAFDTPCAVSVAVEKASVAVDLAAYVGNYTAYDITASYANGYTALQGTATVTLPIPEGVTKPVVLYVSDDGATVEQMDITASTDTTVTFTTDHFSTFVVGDSAEIEVPNATTAEVEGSSTSTQTVYVLTTTLTSGEKYLIVDANTGTGNALMNSSNSVGNASVTIQTGSLTIDGTASNQTYIILDNSNAVWTAGTNNKSSTFKNGSYYLYHEDGQLSLSTSTSKNNWTWNSSSNYLYYTGGGTTRYLTYDGGWTLTTSASEVYLYREETATVNTNVSGTYSIKGTPETLTATVVSGDKVTLGSTLIFTPDSGSVTTTDTTTTATYEIYDAADNTSDIETGDPNGIISGVSGNTVTFSGNTGRALVKVTYTDTVGSTSYTVTNYIQIIAVRRNYQITIKENDTDPGSLLTVKQGAALDLTGTTITYVDGNGVLQTVSGASITWSVDDSDVATVTDGIVTIASDAEGKTATITASWKDDYGNTITDTLTLNVVEAVWDLDLCSPTYTAVAADATFDSSVTYFVKQDDGSYIAATGITEFADGVTYYTQSTKSITAPIIVKDVVANQEYTDVWAVIYKDGVDLGKLTDEQLKKLTFTSSDTEIATIDKTTGKVTFNGKKGTVRITATYEYAEGKYVTDTVVFSVSDEHYYIPEDGTDDFPEYPNEGAIRFDKTATAVGNFSETGITQVELSMTGVPYTVGNEMDVVVMLDMTGSMSDAAMVAAEEAAIVFAQSIILNEDLSYNNNRVAVYAFNIGSNSQQGGNSDPDTGATYELWSLSAITADTWDTFCTAVRTASGKRATGGTPYSVATNECYDVLTKAKTDSIGNDRQQFCVFVSDGDPTSMYYITDADTATDTDNDGIKNYTKASGTSTSYPEYYSQLMKDDGVTIYTIGTGITSGSDAATILANMATDSGKAYIVDASEDQSGLSTVFQSIGQSILEAAKDVKVEDKMTDAFTMVFEAPNAVVDAADGGQEYYIEVKEYALNAEKDANGNITDYTRGTATSKMKLYMGTSNGTYYAASDANGTKYADPVFTTTAIGTKYYWTTDSTKATTWPNVEKDENGNVVESGISVTVDGTTYYFNANGDGTHNMTSGAYAYGTIKEETITKVEGDGTVTDVNSTSQDLIIATPYFVYNAATKVLVWTAEELSNTELALSYFLYLDNSGGWEGSDQRVDPGTYETNEYAELTYSNFNERECEQEMPVPQITWNGAQYSYVFYLVNKAGQPVNRAGRVVPFSEAVYVTDVFTYAVIWSDLEHSVSMEASKLANTLVPDVYELYDTAAGYKIHVYADEKAANLDNHFAIEGSETVNTTYVFNTKADAEKYSAPGVYVANNGEGTDNQTNLTYMCKGSGTVVVEYNTDGSVKSASYELQPGESAQKFNEDPGCDYYDPDTEYAYYLDDNNEWYVIVQKTNATEVRSGFDFSNTTVAFAVVWLPELVPDVVVIDYGLDVVIDVSTNDALSSGVVGVRTDAPDTTINSGMYNNPGRALSAPIEIDGQEIGTASVESLTSVRFALNKTNGMQFTEPVIFYYESEVSFYSNYDAQSTNELQTVSMYSSVTVVPAATIYYEDSFVTFSDGWTTEGTTVNATQAQDRPGPSQISAALDADNLYGYDGAYTNMSEYSMGSARQVTLNSGNVSAEASFTFYGTGFDVVGLTSNQTGTLIVDVFAGGDASGTVVKSLLVDTYFGYTRDTEGNWVAVSSTDPNALYQVPVMAVSGLTYGKYYVRITALYNEFFDHCDGKYDVYLDAIRIYDPTGVVAGNSENDTDGIVSDAYADDFEAWPVYEELRNNVISAADFAAGEINGITFIDGVPKTASVADYVSFGPNNELYLAPNQAIVFNLNLEAYGDTVTAVHLGIKSADGEPVDYVIREGNSLTAEGTTAASLTGSAKTTVSTATDMYYDITDLKDNVIVIYNASGKDGGILSLTNIKVTFTQAHSGVSDLFYVDYDAITAIIQRISAENSGTGEEEGDGAQEGTDTFAPAVAVYYPIGVYTGSAYTVTVKTSEDVDHITVNGTKVEESSKDDSGNLVWTAELTAGTAASEEVKVIAYSADDKASTPVVVTVSVFLDADLVLTLPTKVGVGKAYTLRVSTNADVESVTVTRSPAGDTITVTAYEESDGQRIWEVPFVAGGVGTEQIEVVAYNASNLASEKVTAQVQVEEVAFAPVVDVQLPDGDVYLGDLVTVTVTTSSDVAAVKVNGQLITTYRVDSSDQRVWTADIVATKDNTTENKDNYSLRIEVVAYDNDGRFSETTVRTVDVLHSSNANTATVKDIIKTIVSKLRGWLGWL